MVIDALMFLASLLFSAAAPAVEDEIVSQDKISINDVLFDWKITRREPKDIGDRWEMLLVGSGSFYSYAIGSTNPARLLGGVYETARRAGYSRVHKEVQNAKWRHRRAYREREVIGLIEPLLFLAMNLQDATEAVIKSFDK